MFKESIDHGDSFAVQTAHSGFNKMTKDIIKNKMVNC